MKKSIISISLFFISVSSLAQVTLSGLETEARTLALDGSSAARQRFTNSQIDTWLNEGQREAIIQTRCLRQSLIFNLVPGTTFYSLPSNYLAMERVTVGSKYIQELSPGGLDGRSRGWESASGYPTYYWVNFSSPTLLGFAPWPATATDTDTVKAEFDIQTTDMVNSTDNPFRGVVKMNDYGHALAYYAAAIMSQIQGIQPRSDLFQKMYATTIAGMMKRCLERPNYLPSATGTP
jgi:hypothetical protein